MVRQNPAKKSPSSKAEEIRHLHTGTTIPMPSISFGPLPAECLLDKALHITVHGLTPGQQITLRALSAGAEGTVLASHASFHAATTGDVDLARDAPVSGDYTGADAMGLFWSRSSQPASAVPFADRCADDPMAVLLVIESESAEPVTHAFRRRYFDDSVAMRKVREAGVVGSLFEPKAPGRHPAVLVVGGSGGGVQWSAEMAALLASHGYVALALAYFGAEGLPPTLDRIPLEYFDNALGWLAQQEKVDPDRIAVSGASRGGELALLLASTFPSIRAVVAYVASGIVWPAYPPSGHSAWTMDGKDVPHADVMPLEEWNLAVSQGRVDPDSFDWFLIPLRDEALVEATSIRVENINGPVLLISAQDDKIWPSAALSEFAMTRFERKGFNHPVEHLSYPGAGHSLGWPNVSTMSTRFKHPVSGEDQDLGGSPVGTARAREDSWRKMLAFLRNNL
jgi:dienelactone hydrolase